MKNTRYNGYQGSRMPKNIQLQRIRWAIEQELTPQQREILISYHIHGKNIPQIAQERGVHKSTVCRTLKRAEEKLHRYLKY
jgi:RNA polymerase sigma factor (sigma-70 family)